MFVRTPSHKTRKKTVKPGKYTSVVKDVFADDSYAGEGAFKIIYEFTDATGNKYPFSEIYYDNENDRRNDLLEYLEEQGISYDDLSAFIGCKEEVVIKKVVRGDSAYNNIVERNFVMTVNEVDTDEVEIA